MGKNQAYKAMQRSRVGSSSGAQDEVEDGLVDGSFHTPEWHAARLANLSTSHTVTWEEFKMKQKEEAVKRGEQEADKDRMMREYRLQLDAERERKLSQGRNHSSSKSKNSKHKKDKDKSSKRRSSKKRKHSRRYSSDSSSSDSSSESSSSDEEERESRRSKSRTKKTRKERRHRSRNKSSSTDDEAAGPLPLSRFFGNVKSS
ncbi:zinc finger Ran-binding domain-containing protein 2-like [Chenopodium quinoa]|uniref:zinc finger Ran-binding domain-containing protein 2-like n=1 Tax=Chenopodium quinoa TaxID=63459 RepID=UPI000B76DE13|nr:zinc finger Ran-binding domain-containing protein 2-like [Chenopodium quinoa]